jgi:hypothetical protein
MIRYLLALLERLLFCDEETSARLSAVDAEIRVREGRMP